MPGPVPSRRSHTEALILRGALKLALVTLAAAQETRSPSVARRLAQDAAEGLRIGLEMAEENRDGA